jgi:hypothetical protein
MAAVIGFAVGASWRHMRARNTAHGQPVPVDHDVVFQSSAPPSENQLSPSTSSSTRMTDDVESFSPDLLKRRVGEVFPAGYLTIISIIQGVALGAAIVTTQQQLLDQRSTIDRLTVGVQAFAVFVAIVVITHRYFVLTVNARWTPTILDTLIPYALEVGEITTALLVGRNTAWWVATSVLFLAAIGAFGHTYLREAREPLYATIRESLMTRIIYCSISLAYCVTAAILSANNVHPRWLYAALPCGTIIAAIAVAINGEYTQNKIYDDCGIPRWRASLPTVEGSRS